MTGLESQWWPSSNAFVLSNASVFLRRLSVEDRVECRVSDRSDSTELRRRRGRVGEDCAPSANVAARLNIFWRSWEGIWGPEALLSAGAPSIVL